jgi:2-dehydro-3-deoxyphosphogluconate aldolase/(4S)-4-hydroxy-2-oxoglutarate aldolase
VCSGSITYILTGFYVFDNVNVQQALCLSSYKNFITRRFENMATFTRLEVYNALIESGLVSLFYHKNLETAKNIVSACEAGGCRLVEFTNRGDYAFRVFDQLAVHCAENHPKVMLGVGSVMDAPTAAMYIAHGANFIVGPSLNPEISTLCNRRKIPYIPGCGTVSEISQAEELGAEIVKIFPGDAVGGPKFIKSILGPCPWTRLMPTGGVEATPASVTEWIRAGATCLGMGSDLIVKSLVSQEKWDEISQRVSNVLGWIREARR